MTVKLRFSGWEFGGQHLPWLWGQINYWDLDRSRWRDVLRTYHELGHTVVSTAVLPRIHAVGSGQYDFGAQNPQCDLAAFLDEVKQIGLKAILWVGPRDVPGAAACGYPDELLLDESALARDATGAFIPSSPCAGGDVFALPSLVSERFTQMLEPFRQGLAAAVAAHIHPDGPVIGIGLTQAPGWTPALPAFAADYHPDSVQLFRAFLRRKYRKLTSLSESYGRNFAAFEETEPPRQLDGPEMFPSPQLMDWAEFREEYFVRAAESLHALFSPVGLGRVPVFLATLPVSGSPGNLAELERGRCFDYFAPERPARFAAAESEIGFWLSSAEQTRYTAWYKARPELADYDNSTEAFSLQCQLAAGVRGWDALSPAGSGVLPGFLTDRQGTPVHGYNSFWEALQQTARHEGFLNSQVHADVVLLTIPEFDRSQYLQTPAGDRYDLLDLDPPAGIPGPVLDARTADYISRLTQLEQFLIAQQYAYGKHPALTPAERLNANQLIILPGAEILPATAQILLTDLLERGINCVLVGPMPAHPPQARHVPLADLAGVKPKSAKGSKNPKPGRLYHLPELVEAQLIRVMQQIGVVRELLFDHPNLRLTYHRFRNRIFVAAINPTVEPIESTVSREGKFVLKDFWTAKKFLGGNREIRISIPPRSIKFWELISC